jgi:hypothetical protein
MAHPDSHPDKTVVVSSGSSGAGWFLVGALIVALVGGVWLYNEGFFGGSDADIEITLPKVDVE